MTEQTIGERIKAVRGTQSQDKFAADLGVNPKTIGRYERGENPPTIDFLKDIAHKFRVDIVWLITGDGAMSPREGIHFAEERLVEAREALGYTQAQVAEAIDIPVEKYADMEAGLIPIGHLEAHKLARMNDGFRFLISRQAAPPPSTDTELLGRIIDGVVKLYKHENQRLAPIQQGSIVGRLYDRLIVIQGDEARRGALLYALEELRQELRSSPESGKLSA